MTDLTVVLLLSDEWNLRDITCFKNFGESERKMYRYFYNKLTRVATNTYEWTLPEELDSSVIEQYLWEDGKALIWKHEALGLVVTRCNESSWDINGRANRWVPHLDVNSDWVQLPSELKKDECVCIYDLTNHRICRHDCLAHLSDIVDINETIRQQVWNQKTPMLAVVTDPQNKRKVKTAVDNMAHNMKLLFIEKETLEAIETLNFDAPFNVEALNSAKNVNINEALEYLGVDSESAFDKKERKIVDEQESNDEIINYMLLDGQRARNKGNKDMKKLFGIEATVKVSETIKPQKKKKNITNNNNTT